MNRRQLILGTALALTLAAVWWASTLDDEATPESTQSAKATAPTTRAARRGNPREAVDLTPLRVTQAEFGQAAPPVFARPSPPPPAPMPVVRRAPVPARAVAPALPYTYIGSLQEEGGKRMLFLLDGERLVTARVGDVLDARYRIEAVDDDGITLIYLPLHETQRIVLANRL